MWHRDKGDWAVRKIIDIPAEPADPALLPPALKAFKAVPPLVTEIALSTDDKYLYAACFGTGELRQYDVSDPFSPKFIGSVRFGGIATHAPHPKGGPLNGGTQMLEISRDGRRIYVTNSLYGAWDKAFYPEGIPDASGWSRRRARTVRCRSIPTSTSRSPANGRIRYGLRAATPPRIRTASRRALGSSTPRNSRRRSSRRSVERGDRSRDRVVEGTQIAAGAPRKGSRFPPARASSSAPARR